MSASICNSCTRRKCHTTPVNTKQEGRMSCTKYVPVKGGWSMLELALDSSPHDTLILLHRFGMKAVETKKGYAINGTSKRMRKVRRHRNRKHKTTVGSGD